MGDIARDILSTAEDILVERGKQYGDASLLFSNMAVRFGLVLGIYVSPFQAARIMAELKAARLDLGYHQTTS
jgi:cephalosporin hydroxylase